MIIVEFERQPLRLLLIGERSWWVLADLADALQEPLSCVASQLEPSELLEIPPDNGEGEDLVCTNELGLYHLLRTLNSPLAKRLKRYLQDEAIPSLRNRSSLGTQSVGEALNLCVAILQKAGIDSRRRNQWLLQQYIDIDPHHARIYRDACQLLGQAPAPREPSSESSPGTLPVSDTSTLIPRDLGRILSAQSGQFFSSQKINAALAAMQFQTSRLQGKSKVWDLTQQGLAYGRLVKVKGTEGKSHYQIHWSPQVLEPLKQFLELDRPSPSAEG